METVALNAARQACGDIPLPYQQVYVKDAMHRIKEIDFLRAYAVVAVVILHIVLVLHPEINIKKYFRLDGGVDLFFVISGFVVSDALDRLKKSGLKGGNLYVSFLKRRLKRLWTTSAFWLVYCLLASLVFSKTDLWPPLSDALCKLLSGLFYVYNFFECKKPDILGYFWTLSVEWQFYMILPLLMMLNRYFTNVLLGFLFILGIFYRPGGGEWWMFRYDGIIVGILTWEMQQRNYFKGMENTLFRFRAVQVSISILLLMTILCFAAYIKFLYLDCAVTCLAGGALVALASCDKGYVSLLGMDTMLNWIGVRSYSIYLCHIPVIMTSLSLMYYGRIWLNIWCLIPFMAAVILGVAHLSFQFLETFGRSAHSKQKSVSRQGKGHL